MNLYEILTLENQLAIMWALIVDMPDYEIEKDLKTQIELTEKYLYEIKRIATKKN